jgi:uncharacterized protein YjcR
MMTMQATVAERYGVSANCVRKIGRGDTWKHLESEAA